LAAAAAADRVFVTPRVRQQNCVWVWRLLSEVVGEAEYLLHHPIAAAAAE